MFRLKSLAILCPWLLALFFVFSPCVLPQAHGADKEHSMSRDRKAALKQETDELIKRMAEDRAFLQEQIDQFVAKHPAAPGSDRDFPYDQTLYPIIDHVSGGAKRTSLCVGKNAASAELWCNAIAGPSVVHGDKLFVIPNRTTEVLCEPRLADADADLSGDILGVHMWRRSKDILYLDDVRFRIDPRPNSCKPYSWAWP